MHIALTANAAWNIWNFRRALVSALMADGHAVTVLAPPDDSVGDLEALGCRFLPLRMNVRGLNPLEELAFQRRFRHTLEAEKPDAVLSFTIKNNVFGALAARAAGIPFVPNVTGLGTAFLSDAILRHIAETLYRRAFRPLPAVFFENVDDRDLFQRRGLVRAEQAHVLPGTGIDLAHFAAADMPAMTAPPIFLMIARLLRDKGVVEFVEAARQLKRTMPEARFQLLGAADSENRTAIDAATVDAWVAEGVVEYLGTAPDVRPHIAAATCVVLPSYREGAPRTLIEAAAMARPAIATDVPGCRAVVEDGVSGLLCRVRDTESLAATMRRFLALSHAERARMGAAGRTRMEREFDEAIVLGAYRDAIDMVVRRSAPAESVRSPVVPS